MLPLRSTAICATKELPALLDTFFGVEKVAPLSVERLKDMSDWKLKSSSQATLMLPSAPTAICGPNEPLGFLAKFTGAENVVPSVECVKRTPFVTSSFSQTTLM